LALRLYYNPDFGHVKIGAQIAPLFPDLAYNR